MKLGNYLLITAARNEEAFIERTLQSVIRQTVLPHRWLIISDGSTDRTDDIVREYAEQHPFIDFVRADGDRQRNFGSKAKAFNFGYALLRDLEYDYLGNLDADLTLPPTYYEKVLKKFAANQRLGVAGGTRFDWYKDRFIPVSCAPNSVGGPFQLFRRECLEQLGGYQTLPFGGIDAVAEISARMHGWEVRSFPDIKVYHHRFTGQATGNIIRSGLRNGYKFYAIGYDPLFHTARTLRQVFHKPYFSSLLSLGGYLWAALRGYQRPVSSDFMEYLRSEQRQRLFSNRRKSQAIFE